MARINLIFLVLMSSGLAGQVNVDRSLILNGPTNIERQVTGLPNMTTGSAILTAGVEQAGTYRTADASGTDLWTVDLPSLENEPIAGTHLMVTTPATASGQIGLMINGTGPYALVDAIQSPFDATNVPPGTPLSIVFDGASFHVLNGSIYARKPCDPGLVAVGEEFCIEPTEHEESDFFEASSNCAANGLRLCSWTEYIVACNKRIELGLTGMINNWEWTDDAVNENGSARIAGSVTCNATGTALVTNSIDRGSRCCHTR